MRDRDRRRWRSLAGAQRRRAGAAPPRRTTRARRSSGSPRIDPQLHSVIAVDPTAIDQARRVDAGSARGPLAGLPVLIKDNIETRARCRRPPAASRWPTTSPTATRRWSRGCARPGAVILGKTNLSEWANIRSNQFDLGLERGRRPDPQSLGARPQPVRQLERQRRGGRGGPGAAGDRHRDRRIGHLPGGDQRHRRAEADGRPGQPDPYRADQPQPGHAGADDRERARSGRAADARSPAAIRPIRRPPRPTSASAIMPRRSMPIRSRASASA